MQQDLFEIFQKIIVFVFGAKRGPLLFVVAALQWLSFYPTKFTNFAVPDCPAGCE